jgi:hypothetical protein
MTHPRGCHDAASDPAKNRALKKTFQALRICSKPQTLLHQGANYWQKQPTRMESQALAGMGRQWHHSQKNHA